MDDWPADLIAFLKARLDEDEAGAWSVHDVAKCDAILYEDLPNVAPRDVHCDCGYPDRVRRDLAAKRRLIAEYEDCHNTGNSPDHYDGYWDAIVRFAAVYSDHPDYQQKWAV